MIEKTEGIILLCVEAFIFWLIWYFFMPVISPGMFISGYLYLSILIIIVGSTIAAMFDEDYFYKFSIFSVIIAILIIIIGGIASSSFVNSETMYNQIGTFEVRDFKNDVLEIDSTQIPIVDIELAKRLADKKLGEELALGSQYEVGEFTNKQHVNGKLVYVAPLEYRDIFKWNANKTVGCPGYVIVSATNPNDVELVLDINGEDMHMKYMNSACFSDDLKRHIKMSGFSDVGLTEFSFELNDEGYPYWVVTTYENTTLWGNPEATGVVVCDPQSGKCDWYDVAEAPDWIDIIQPEWIVKKQLSNYGSLVHGWWNPSEKDELSVTEYITTVYNDGNCFYYTGMSSSGADQGTVGFVMVNTRTKAVVYYKMAGATEEAAMNSAPGPLQEKGYQVSQPIPLNISGIPAYFCTLKDNEGLIRAYSMIEIEDYSIVATGTTIQETRRTFINLVNSSGGGVDFGDSKNIYAYEQEGIVTRIGNNIENGNTYYYFILDDDSSKLFLASYAVSEELPITREGDKVKVSYVDQSNGAINIVSFDNLEFTQKISEGQQILNDEQEQNNLINGEDTTIIMVDPENNQEIWDNLSDEEKAKLLEQIEN